MQIRFKQFLVPDALRSDVFIAIVYCAVISLCNLSFVSFFSEVANESDDLPFQSMDWKSDGSLLVTSCRVILLITSELQTY